MDEHLFEDAGLLAQPTGRDQVNATLVRLQFLVTVALSMLRFVAQPQQTRKVRSAAMKAAAAGRHIPALRRSPAVRAHMIALGNNPDEEFDFVEGQVRLVSSRWEELYGGPLYQPTGVRFPPTADDGVRVHAAREGARVVFPPEELEALAALPLGERVVGQLVLARRFGVNVRTVQRALVRLAGGPLRAPQSPLQSVIAAIMDIKTRHPAVGQANLLSYLRRAGIATTPAVVRRLLREFDASSGHRALGGIVRVVYYADYAMQAVHFDGHHKLMFAGFVIHVGVDGRTGMVLWLKVVVHNRAEGVFGAVMDALRGPLMRRAVPTLFRCDHGKENVLTQHLVERLCAEGMHCHVITGTSTRNQPAEQFWSVVSKDLSHPMAAIVAQWAEYDQTDPLDQVAFHVAALRYVQRLCDDIVGTHNDGVKRGTSVRRNVRFELEVDAAVAAGKLHVVPSAVLDTVETECVEYALTATNQEHLGEEGQYIGPWEVEAGKLGLSVASINRLHAVAAATVMPTSHGALRLMFQEVKDAVHAEVAGAVPAV